MKFLGRISESLTVARRFTVHLHEHRGVLSSAMALSMGAILLELVRPWPMQWIFDYALTSVGPQRWSVTRVVTVSVATVAVVTLGRAYLQYLGTLRVAQVGHQVTRSIRHRIFDHLSKLSPRFHARYKSGDLMVRLMGDVPMLKTMLVDSSLELITRSLLLVGMIAVMAAVDPLLTVILAASIPLVLLVIRGISRHITVAVHKQRKKEGVLANFLHEAVAATPVLQSLGRSQDTVHRFARDNRSSARAGLKATRLAARLSFTVEALLAAIVAGTLALGAWRVVGGELSPGKLLVFLSYVRGMLKPVRATAKNSERIAKGAACGQRILEVLDERIEIPPDEGHLEAPLHPRVLAFDHVRFAYEGERPALDDFDMEFRAGELVGVFGRSGAGKSTMATLAVRLFDPDEGSLRLDGVDLRDYRLDGLRRQVGLCIQETVLFGDTVRENLLLGRPDARDDELWTALDDAGAVEFVQDLNEGLDTSLGALGAGLSGGQRRRLALARTLLRNSPVLILDEPFNGLDQPSVERVCEALRRRAETGIVIVITHDREHLPVFDRVVFVAGGKAVKQEVHAERERRGVSDGAPPGLHIRQGRT